MAPLSKIGGRSQKDQKHAPGLHSLPSSLNQTPTAVSCSKSPTTNLPRIFEHPHLTPLMNTSDTSEEQYINYERASNSRLSQGMKKQHSTTRSMPHLAMSCEFDTHLMDLADVHLDIEKSIGAAPTRKSKEQGATPGATLSCNLENISSHAGVLDLVVGLSASDIEYSFGHAVPDTIASTSHQLGSVSESPSLSDTEDDDIVVVNDMPHNVTENTLFSTLEYPATSLQGDPQCKPLRKANSSSLQSVNRDSASVVRNVLTTKGFDKKTGSKVVRGQDPILEQARRRLSHALQTGLCLQSSSMQHVALKSLALADGTLTFTASVKLSDCGIEVAGAASNCGEEPIRLSLE